jgi:segregation and condensation protein A
MKKAALSLGEVPVAGRDFSVVEVYLEQSLAARLPGVAVADLSEAWRSILARAKMTKHHKITREQLSVRSHMSRILRELGGGAFTEFSLLFKPEEGVSVLVVSFLALLELARESLIEITQQSAFEPIYVRLKRERAALTIT